LQGRNRGSEEAVAAAEYYPVTLALSPSPVERQVMRRTIIHDTQNFSRQRSILFVIPDCQAARQSQQSPGLDDLLIDTSPISIAKRLERRNP
jgi:hypothetical protein